MATSLDALIDQILQGPRTLVHGDYRADNLMYRDNGDGQDLLVIDWQITNQGAGTFDLGYLMSGSVDAEVRRGLEMDVLRRYHSQLLEGGVEGYDFAQCFHDYRRALLIGFTYCVQGGGAADLTHPRTIALLEGIARRCEAAVEDHGLTEFLV